jgi:hypothetical protein
MSPRGTIPPINLLRGETRDQRGCVVGLYGEYRQDAELRAAREAARRRTTKEPTP